MLDLEVCARTESSNDGKPLRVKEVFPENQLTFPVKDGSVKTVVPGILEEVRDHEEGHARSSEDMLAQTPHDIVPREPTHNTGVPRILSRPLTRRSKNKVRSHRQPRTNG